MDLASGLLYDDRMRLEGGAWWVVCSIVAMSSEAHAEIARPGERGTWQVAVGIPLIWMDMGNDRDAGLGLELLVSRTIRPHVVVGGRGVARSAFQIQLFGSERAEPELVYDLGPIVGVATTVGRLALTASVGPMLTGVKRQVSGDPETNVTVGLGVDAAIGVRLTRGVYLGVGAEANLNRDRPVASGALTVSTAFR